MVYGNSSPRKIIPLRGEDPQSSSPSLTKRAFFCGVVVEESEHSGSYTEEVQDLVASLGRRFLSEKDRNANDALDEDMYPDKPTKPVRERALTDTSALGDRIDELITTERSYVRKLQAIKHDYADPIRSYGRSKDTTILPLFDAKVLFGNIDSILPANEAFLKDLERMLASHETIGHEGIGDIALRHFRDLGTFDCYRHYYSQRDKAQTILERETSRKKVSTGFGAYIDRIQYSNPDIKVGLGQLLMEPVQRIPRYTMMFKNIMKYMDPDDPQCQKLKEADEIASRIALAETDDETKRGTILYSLASTIEGFPADLIKPSRSFIDCLDVEDINLDAPSASSSQVSLQSALHCTLFLLNDKLLLVKRPGNGDKGGRALSGLDDVERLGNVGLPPKLKKNGLTFKGAIDVTAIVATDIGGPDLHLFLESPPQNMGERWSGRPFRALSVVHPPCNLDLDPIKTRKDKERFLAKVWAAQARFRAREGRSVVLRSSELEVEAKGVRRTVAHTYYNIYQRTAFLKEPVKTKVVVQVDATGTADPIPFGHNSAPFVVIRLCPLRGDLCRFDVADVNDYTEQDVLPTSQVPARIVQTIHNYGLFKFRTSNDSAPSTPTASIRSRAAIFGLEAISRNLFNTRPRSDVFASSLIGHRRTKSTTSHSSVLTETTITESDSLMKMSHRSNSTATAATTISRGEQDMSVNSRKLGSLSRSRKLVKRSKSPSGARSRSVSRERDSGYSDTETLGGVQTLKESLDLDESERDLSRRLELARRNSQNQSGHDVVTRPREPPMEDTIYEDESLSRNLSRTSRDGMVTREPSVRSRTPEPVLRRSPSPYVTERRPAGPRSPSPLPHRSPVLSKDVELALNNTLVNFSQSLSAMSPLDSLVFLDRGRSPSPSPSPRRLPLVPTGNTPAPSTPRRSRGDSASKAIEPLSIKKKTPIHDSIPFPTTPAAAAPVTPTRKSYARTPLARSPNKMQSINSSSLNASSPKRNGSLVNGRAIQTVSSAHSTDSDISVERIQRLHETTREDVTAAHRAIKRIRLEVENLKAEANSCSAVELLRKSPPCFPTRPQGRVVRHGTVTKAARERMDEMHMMIGMRGVSSNTPGGLGERDAPEAPLPVEASGASDVSRATVRVFAETVDRLTNTAIESLDRVTASQTALSIDVQEMVASAKQRSTDLEVAHLDVQNAKRQTEVVKSLLTDVMAEKEIMYEAFNEELDGMFNDVQLPETEAWAAMSKDLRETKAARNVLREENAQLKRRLAESEMEKEEWGKLLRAHGLIPSHDRRESDSSKFSLGLCS